MRNAMAVVLMLASMVTSAAYAAVPSGVEAVFTGATTDFGTIVGYGWTAFLAIIGGLILFGLVKRVLHKATGA